MLILRPSKEFKFPVRADCISPDVFQGRTLEEIKRMKMWEGNKERNLGELFKIEDVKADDHADRMVMTISGDVAKVRRIGSKMKNGEITINGNVGMHLGEEMRGGKIVVNGNAEGWVGSMMKGGSIELHGNAGDYLGAPYRGSDQGINGGRIVVHGNVGVEAGSHMKKGIIKICGNVGQFAGFRMCNGTMYIGGDCEARAGACMKDGKIIVKGRIESVIPTFTVDSVRTKVKIEEDEVLEGPLLVFLGDIAENGNGKLYVSKAKNPHLAHYENLL